MIENIGADLYKSWSEEQRRAEISKLVDGYRAGIALKILFQMACAIAGSPEDARDHLAALIPAEERHRMVMKEKGEAQTLAASFLM
jgi:hypothetical protein